jgi:hypothetical protein
MTTNCEAGVDLYWIPLGAGGHSVRFNGIVYEATTARLQHRTRCDIYHAALVVHLLDDRYTVEMTPVPDTAGSTRGVVAEGPVGTKMLGHLRLFRYEVRRWRDGIVPDLGHAVASPVRVTDRYDAARRIFELLPEVPTAVWGRDGTSPVLAAALFEHGSAGLREYGSATLGEHELVIRSNKRA